MSREPLFPMFAAKGDPDLSRQGNEIYDRATGERWFRDMRDWRDLFFTFRLVDAAGHWIESHDVRTISEDGTLQFRVLSSQSAISPDEPVSLAKLVRMAPCWRERFNKDEVIVVDMRGGDYNAMFQPLFSPE